MSKPIYFCPDCDRQVLPTHRICPGCGSRLAFARPDPPAAGWRSADGRGIVLGAVALLILWGAITQATKDTTPATDPGAAYWAAETPAAAQRAAQTAAAPPPAALSADAPIRLTPFPTWTSAPTPVGVGGTETVKGWDLRLADVNSQATLMLSGFGGAVRPNGLFWELWIDARNTANASRNLASDLHWKMRDDHGAEYDDLSYTNPFAMDEAAQYIGRDPLGTTVTPRGSTQALLVFDIAVDAKPASLTISDAAPFASDYITFSLAQYHP